MNARDLDYMLDLWEVKRAADQVLVDRVGMNRGSRSYYGHKDPTGYTSEKLSQAIDLSDKCRIKLAALSERLDRLLKKQEDSFAAALVKAEYIDGYYYSDIMKVAHKMGESNPEERHKAVVENIIKMKEV